MDINITEGEVIVAIICALIAFCIIPGLLVLYSRIMDYLTDTAGLPMAAYQTGAVNSMVNRSASAEAPTEHVVRVTQG